MRKKALITGASRGIGEAIAKELARQGFDLTLTCLNSLDQLKELAGCLEKKYGVSCHIFQGDMGDPEAVDRLFDGLNRLDVLINNAGIFPICPFPSGDVLCQLILTAVFIPAEGQFR